MLDAAVAAWILIWLGVGVTVAEQVARLGGIATTFTDVGRTMDQTAAVLGHLRGLPFVGGGIGPLVAEAHRSAASAAASAQTLRQSAASLSVLMGVFVTAVPAVLALALYLPFRVRLALDTRAVRRALLLRDPAFDEFLARRALQNLSYQALRRVTLTPWRDVEAGRYGALADAELRRLGLRRAR